MRKILGTALTAGGLALALPADPSKAGVVLNGTSFNGASLNGVSLNGVALNGANLNGVSFNGTAGRGSTEVLQAVDPSALTVRSIRLPDGRVLHVSAP